MRLAASCHPRLPILYDLEHVIADSVVTDALDTTDLLARWTAGEQLQNLQFSCGEVSENHTLVNSEHSG